LPLPFPRPIIARQFFPTFLSVPHFSCCYRLGPHLLLHWRPDSDASRFLRTSAFFGYFFQGFFERSPPCLPITTRMNCYPFPNPPHFPPFLVRYLPPFSPFFLFFLCFSVAPTGPSVIKVFHRLFSNSEMGFSFFQFFPSHPPALLFGCKLTHFIPSWCLFTLFPRPCWQVCFLCFFFLLEPYPCPRAFSPILLVLTLSSLSRPWFLFFRVP